LEKTVEKLAKKAVSWLKKEKKSKIAVVMLDIFSYLYYNKEWQK